jgi:hypothetical protein
MQISTLVDSYLINGPSGSGKDTIGTIAYKIWGNQVCLDYFARPIEAAIVGFFNLSTGEVEDLKANKTKQYDLLRGKCWREIFLSFAEDWAKDFFDRNVFGHMLATKHLALRNNKVLIITDLGFSEEWEAILSAYPDVPKHILYVTRGDNSWKNDSRRWVTPNMPHTSSWIKNDSTLENLEMEVRNELKRFFSESDNS